MTRLRVVILVLLLTGCATPDVDAQRYAWRRCMGYSDTPLDWIERCSA